MAEIAQFRGLTWDHSRGLDPMVATARACRRRRPDSSAGGRRQRVAMGRAIMRQPQAFLFDEPLSSLDAKLGAETILFCSFAGMSIQAKMFNPRSVAPGETLDFRCARDKTHLYDAETGESLRI